MFDREFETVAAEWLKNCLLWVEGKHPDQIGQDERPKYFWQWDGDPPDEEYYRPKWTDEERTHYQMYEDTSEGTPISPVMESPETLARWLVDNHASAFGAMEGTYEGWLRIARGGWAPSAVVIDGKMMSGVDAGGDSR